ncbi:MAG TPA: DUF2282 domain-containing protein [Steroidobacteraceae bacterium]|nr:DUF2282 domain-containing protein [Steroidobacteraceae bacterium]
MNRYAMAASTLSAALGLAVAMTSTVGAAEIPANAPAIVKQNMMRAQKDHLEKCYGINAVSKNDCAEGAHSCAGQATSARDPKSFVLLPAGDCEKIAGGSVTAG